MLFAQTRMLMLAAVAVPALALFFWWSWRKRQHLSRQFVQTRLLAQLTLGISTTVQKWRMILLLGAVASLFLALARPMWGESTEEVRQRGLDIIVAIDTSRSMLAADLAPNRLRRAKLAALDLMKLAKFDRLGLVAFAGTAFLQCPLTLDEEAFRQSVNALEAGIIPQGGTDVAGAIETAIQAFKKEGDNFRVLVLFTDGEDHEEGVQAAMDKAKQEDVRVFTIGVGTAGGEVMRVQDEQGRWDYVKDAQGNVVKSRLNETALTEIATRTGGFYLPLGGANAMDVLYEKGLKPLPRGETATKMIRQHKDQFMWPLGLAAVLLIVEVFLPDRKQRAGRAVAPIPTAANEELRKAVAMIVFLFMVTSVHASSRSALRQYESGRYQEAYREYNRLVEKTPKDARLQYNAGAAAYQANQFDQAVEHFESALDPAHLDLQQQAYYNLGNTRYRLGENADDPQQKMSVWEKAAEDYGFALKLKPDDRDAQFNLDLVKKKLEELKQQQQDKQDQKEDQNKDGKEKAQDKQDGQNQEKKDEQQKKNSDSDKSDQPKEQPKPEEQEKKENQQPSEKKDDHKGDEQKDGQKAGQPKEQDGKEQQPSEQSMTAQGQMTKEQVEKLLNALRGEEKAMIFQPPPDKQARPRNRIFKDW